MLELQKMTTEEFSSIMETSLLRFISDLEVYHNEFIEKIGVSPQKFVEGKWSHMLPDGINTENNYLWVIKKCNSGESLGHLMVVKHPEKKITFINDIFLKKEYRGAGYGTFILHLVEKIAKMEHLSQAIELHVFRHNNRAMRLYDRMGFVTNEEDFTGYRMLKKI